jgi:FkbH-like protein
LTELNLFETASFARDDFVRTKQYQIEVQRLELQQQFASTDDYLKNLEMISECGPFTDYYVPRISQLTQRSNQFNLRTVRYTEHDINRIKQSDEYLTQYFTLRDKFGDYGLISLVIMKKTPPGLFIDTWIMSCRVLLRGMEAFVLNKLVKIAKEKGFNKLIGEYIETAKNGLVKDHYQKLGFIENGGLWELDIQAFEEKKMFIKEAVS